MWWGIGAFLILFLGGKKVTDTMDQNALDWIKFDDLFKKYGQKYGVDWQWLKAIALNESDLGRVESVANGIKNPNDIENSVSDDGLSWGLMQVTLRTAKSLDPQASEIKLNKPEYSIDLASRYLKQMTKLFDETEFIIKSYNQGPGNSKKERDGMIEGYAQAYWDRFQRNLERVKQGSF